MPEAVAAPPRGVTSHTVLDYLRAVRRSAEALPAAHVTRRRIRTAGLLIDARFTDRELAALYCDRLDGVPVPDSDEVPDLRIDVLSASTLGWPTPAAWRDTGCPMADFDRLFEATELRAIYPYHPGFWQFYAPADGYGVQLQSSPDERPPWDGGAPLRLHLHWTLAARQRRLVHSATLGVGGNGILLVGRGGAGKSSTTIAGLAAGLQTVGDDYVVVDLDPPRAQPVFRIGKLDPPAVARLGAAGSRLAGRALNWQGKIEFELDRLFPSAVVRELRLRAIVLPQVAGTPASTLTRLPAAAAMREMTFANLYQLPCELNSGFRFLGGLTRYLPAYRLSLSSDPQEIGATLRRFIEGLTP